MVIDESKFYSMVDDFCMEKRPKSNDIKNMVRACRCTDIFLQPVEYQSDGSENNIEDAIKLDMAVAVFSKMLEEMPTISMKDFLQHMMYTYDLTQYDILQNR